MRTGQLTQVAVALAGGLARRFGYQMFSLPNVWKCLLSFTQSWHRRLMWQSTRALGELFGRVKIWKPDWRFCECYGWAPWDTDERDARLTPWICQNTNSSLKLCKFSSVPWRLCCSLPFSQMSSLSARSASALSKTFQIKQSPLWPFGKTYWEPMEVCARIL